MSGNRDLTGLVLSAGPGFVRPKRALAFERLDASDVIPRFPELVAMYEHMGRADAEALRMFPDNAEARTKFVSVVRLRIQSALGAGELRVPQIARDPAIAVRGIDPER